jgi:hypothetical protein
MVTLGLLTGVAVAVAWYCYFARSNRRRATEVMRWVERVFGSHGRAAEMAWESASQFRVRMELVTSMFHQASLVVQLFPRQHPLSWLVKRIRHQAETLTFQADLDSAPSFNLEVHNYRWYGRSRRRLSSEPHSWDLHQTSPFVFTTRNDWQREITSMMNALVASRECDCSCVSIRRSSPHFSATVPLEIMAPGAQSQPEIFDVLRELATGASTARF